MPLASKILPISALLIFITAVPIHAGNALAHQVTDKCAASPTIEETEGFINEKLRLLQRVNPDDYRLRHIKADIERGGFIVTETHPSHSAKKQLIPSRKITI